MSYLRHIHACNPPITEPFLPWFIGDRQVGAIRPVFAQKLAEYPDVFRVLEEAVYLHDSLVDFAQRSAALDRVIKNLYQKQHIPLLSNEFLPITAGHYTDAVAKIDRAVTSYFGLRSFGQHLNGYVRDHTGIRMWIGKRSDNCVLSPGALDNMVAGGLPYGLSLQENLLKECQEEAGMPKALAQQSIPVGAVTYRRLNSQGLRPDAIYCYDIELPRDFTPQNKDGEVASFQLMPLDEVAHLVQHTDDFKLNCNLVVLDFLLRHGFIQPEAPDYLAINQGLRQFAVSGLCIN